MSTLSSSPNHFLKIWIKQFYLYLEQNYPSNMQSLPGLAETPVGLVLCGSVWALIEELSCQPMSPLALVCVPLPLSKHSYTNNS